MQGGFLKGVVLGSATAMVVLMAATAFAGTGVGAVFNLGKTNSVNATSTLTGSKNGRMLQVTNTSTGGSASGIGITVSPGTPPLKVNSSAKVGNLNADQLDGIDSTGFLSVGAKAADSDQLDGIDSTGFLGVGDKAADSDMLDGLDSTGFLRNLVPLSLTGADNTGVIRGTNTGGGNGVQGVTSSSGASGVYGENDAGGFGVAGRGGDATHAAAFVENTGNGIALELRSSGGAAPLKVNSNAKVVNLNADLLDGMSSADYGHLITNRLVNPSPGAVLLSIPTMGELKVASCTDNTSGSVGFTTVATGNADFMVNENGSQFDTIGTLYTSPSTLVGFVIMNIARDTGASTDFVTVWVSWDAHSCRFQAQAIEHLAA
jgi:hypothetical protein